MIQTAKNEDSNSKINTEAAMCALTPQKPRYQQLLIYYQKDQK